TGRIAEPGYRHRSSPSFLENPANKKWIIYIGFEASRDFPCFNLTIGRLRSNKDLIIARHVISVRRSDRERKFSQNSLVARENIAAFESADAILFRYHSYADEILNRK